MEIGDRVRCIRSVDAYTHVGAVYTIMDKEWDVSRTERLLRLDVHPGTFYSPKYFEPVAIHYDAPAPSSDFFKDPAPVLDLSPIFSDPSPSVDTTPDFSGGGGDFGGGGDSGSW